MCLIWRFIVNVKRMQKYTRRMGQNTGMSKTRNRVKKNAITIERVEECLHETNHTKSKNKRLIKEKRKFY